MQFEHVNKTNSTPNRLNCVFFYGWGLISKGGGVLGLDREVRVRDWGQGQGLGIGSGIRTAGH